MRAIAAMQLDSEPGTQTEKAAKYGIDQSSFSQLVTGRRSPGKRTRLKIHERGGPAPELWDQFPPEPAAPKPRMEAPDVGPIEATPERVNAASTELMTWIAQEMETIRLNPIDDQPGGRSKALVALAAAMKSLGGITGDGILSENQILKSPAFRELMRVLLEALEPFPDARVAVIEALEARQ